MTVTNEFERDLINQAHLKRAGRVDMIVFQNQADVGDGSPGIQRCFRNYLHEGGMEKDLQLIGHGIKGTSVNINNVELQQLSNIGAVTINVTQWGYVGAFNQGLTSTSNVAFGQITMSGNIIMGSDDITFTAGGLVDGVDVSAHDHSGSDKGVAVPFTSLSGDIIYTQLDSIVDTSGTGGATLISRANHVHTASDGSSKITHANILSPGASDHHTKYTDGAALVVAKVGNESDNAMHSNDTERSSTSSSGTFKVTWTYTNITLCKVTYDIKVDADLGGHSEFWLEKNGVQVGFKDAPVPGDWETITHTGLTFKKGDYVRIQYNENPYASEMKRVRNLRIKYDLFTDQDP